jgi:hypothetical protein
MQLDLRHFQVKVDCLTRLRPLPDPSIVETYIKAYYLPENALEKWIQEQTVIILIWFEEKFSFQYCFKLNATIVLNIFSGIFSKKDDESSPVCKSRK